MNGQEDRVEIPLKFISEMPLGYAYHEIVVDKENIPVDYVFLDANREFEKLTGLKRGEIIGKRVTSVLPGIENDPADWIGTYGRVASTGQTIRFEQFSEVLQRWYSVTAYSPERGYFATVFTDATEKRKAEEKLRESEERFRKIFNEGPLGMAITGLDRQFLSVNKHFCDMLGYTEQELVTLTFADITHPEHAEKDLLAAKKLLNGEINVYNTEKKYLKKNQEIIWGSLTVSVVRDEDRNPVYNLAMIEDITKKKRDEEQLLYHANLVNNISDAVISTDMDFIIKTWSRGAEMIYDWKESEVLGKYYREVVPNITGDLREDVKKQLLESGIWRGEFVQERKDGTTINTHSLISLLRDSDGKPAGALAVNRDITSRKKAEKIAEFLYSLLRHDINNKITVIHGYLSLLEKLELSNKQQGYVDKAKRGCADGIELIRKTSSLRTINRAILEETRQVDLVSVLQDVINVQTGRATDLGMTIDLKLTSKEITIIGGVLLKELFTNLIENSIVHSSGNLLKVTTEEHASHVVVVLEDNGKGIPDINKNKVFRSGFRGVDSNGSGMGLYLVKTIIETYGGNITVKDSSPSGVKFEVTLQKARI